MKDINELIKLKKVMKAKKPKFTREDSHKKPSLGEKWRKPRGVHSKMRHQFRGYKRKVKEGYKTPKLLKGKNREGLEFITVTHKEQLNIDPNKFIVILPKTLGFKKRKEILKICLEKGIKVQNIKDINKYLERKETFLEKRRERIKTLKVEREERKKKKEEKKKEKKGIEEQLKPELSEEEKKEQEKKEIDKLLTKKDTPY